MNFKTLAIETRELPSTEETENLTCQETAEIAPLPLESFRLVGGGEGIVVL
jgi:hypothetical protein